MSAKIYVNGEWKGLSDPQVTITPVVDQFCYRNQPKQIPIDVNYGGGSAFGTIQVEGLPDYATYSDGVIIVQAPEGTEREQYDVTVKLMNGNILVTGIKFTLKVAGASYRSTEGLYLREASIFQEDEYHNYPKLTDPARCVGPVCDGKQTCYKILNGILYRDNRVCTGAPTDGSYAVCFAHNTASTLATASCYVVHSDGTVYPVSSDEYKTPTPNEITGIKKIAGYRNAMFMTESTAGYYGDGTNAIVASLGVTDPIVDVTGPCYTAYQWGAFIAAGNHLFCCKYNAPELTVFPTSYDFPSNIKKLTRTSSDGGTTYVLTEDGKCYAARIVDESAWDIVEIVAPNHKSWSEVSGYPSDYTGALGICDNRLYLIINTTVHLLYSEHPVTAVTGLLTWMYAEPTSNWTGGLFVANGHLYSVIPTSRLNVSDVLSHITVSQITDNGSPVQVGDVTALYGLIGTTFQTSSVQTCMVVSEQYDRIQYGDDPSSIPVVSVNDATPDTAGKVSLQAELVLGNTSTEVSYSSFTGYNGGIYPQAKNTQLVMLSFIHSQSAGAESNESGYLEAGAYNPTDESFTRRAYVELSTTKHEAFTLTFMVAPGECPAFRYESNKTFTSGQVRATINNFTIKISPA